MWRESVCADEFTRVPHDSRQSHATSATKELFRERYAAMCLEALDVRPDARKRSIKKFKDRLRFLKNVASLKKCEKENTKLCPLSRSFLTYSTVIAPIIHSLVYRRDDKLYVYLFPRTSANFCQNISYGNFFEMAASLFRVDIKSRSIIIVRRIIQSSRNNLYAANAEEG